MKSRGKIVCGGETNEEDRYIAPTLVDVKEDDPLFEDEVCVCVHMCVEVDVCVVH